MLSKIKKFIYHKENIIIFKNFPFKEKSFPDSKGILVFKDIKEIPPSLIKTVFPGISFLLLKFRLWRKKATLICYIKEGQLLAYGWIQDWSYFKPFHIIEYKASMLGPFWTHPQYRGQGIYGKMLDYSLNMIDPQYPAIIYASQGNSPSLKGIRNHHFREIGPFQFLRKFFFFRKLSPVTDVANLTDKG